VDSGNDGRRRIESVERGAFGAVVFLGRQERLQFLAGGLPAGVLILAAERIGKDGQGDCPEAAEAGERLLLFSGGWPLLLLDGFEDADGGEDVAGFALFAAGDRYG